MLIRVGRAVCYIILVDLVLEVRKNEVQSSQSVRVNGSAVTGINATNSSSSMQLTPTHSHRVTTTVPMINPSSVTSSPVPISSIVNTTDSPSNADKSESDSNTTKITMYLLIVCVALFVFIIAILIVLVVQMRALSKKIRK